MRRVALLSAIVLLATAWMFAQTSSSQESTSPQSGTTSMSPQSSTTSTQTSTTTTQTDSNSGQNQASFVGCLQGSSGNFSLVANNGKTYQLQGEDSQLGRHIGQEVSITGTIPAGSEAAMSGAGQGASSQPSSTQGGMAGTSSASTSNPSSSGMGTQSSASTSNPASSTSSQTSSSGMSTTSPAAATGSAALVNVTNVSKVSDTCGATK